MVVVAALHEEFNGRGSAHSSRSRMLIDLHTRLQVRSSPGRVWMDFVLHASILDCSTANLASVWGNQQLLVLLTGHLEQVIVDKYVDSNILYERPRSPICQLVKLESSKQCPCSLSFHFLFLLLPWPFETPVAFASASLMLSSPVSTLPSASGGAVSGLFAFFSSLSSSPPP